MIRAYLDTLSWDGVHRLPYWLRPAFGITNPHHLRMGELWMIAAVRRVYEPGRAVHAVLGLEGAPCIGKSQVLAILGGPFYAPTYGEGNPRANVWIEELHELRDDMKAVVFARHGLPQTSYALTTNHRAGVVRQCCRRIRWVKCLRPLDAAWMRDQRDQLWAEARVRLKHALQCEARERREAAVLRSAS